MANSDSIKRARELAASDPSGAYDMVLGGRSTTAGAGMTDDEMHFLANVLKDGPRDAIIGKLHKSWKNLWDEWEDVGKFQQRLERAGVGGTEADSLFLSRLEPVMARFLKDFTDIKDHLTNIAKK